MVSKKVLLIGVFVFAAVFLAGAYIILNNINVWGDVLQNSPADESALATGYGSTDNLESHPESGLVINLVKFGPTYDNNSICANSDAQIEVANTNNDTKTVYVDGVVHGPSLTIAPHSTAWASEQLLWCGDSGVYVMLSSDPIGLTTLDTCWVPTASYPNGGTVQRQPAITGNWTVSESGSSWSWL